MSPITQKRIPCPAARAHIWLWYSQHSFICLY